MAAGKFFKTKKSAKDISFTRKVTKIATKVYDRQAETKQISEDLIGTVDQFNKDNPLIRTCCRLASGAVEEQRIGNEVKILRIDAKLRFGHVGSVVDNSVIRVMLLYRTQPAPTPADFDPGVDLAVQLGDLSAYKLFDRRYYISQKMGVDNANNPIKLGVDENKPILNFEKNLKLKLPVRYFGSLATNIESGELFLYCTSDQTGTTANTGVGMDGYVRIYYKDS